MNYTTSQQLKMHHGTKVHVQSHIPPLSSFFQTYGSASKIGRAFSWIFDGWLKLILYTPLRRVGFLSNPKHERLPSITRPTNKFQGSIATSQASTHITSRKQINYCGVFTTIITALCVWNSCRVKILIVFKFSSRLIYVHFSRHHSILIINH